MRAKVMLACQKRENSGHKGGNCFGEVAVLD